MSKFKLRDLVRMIGGKKIHMVVDIRTNPSHETLYGIQIGNDSSPSEVVYESQLELAAVPEGPLTLSGSPNSESISTPMDGFNDFSEKVKAAKKE